MGHYKSNVRDQVFNLFEVFGVDKALGQEGEGSPADSAAAARHFADDSREDVTAVLTSLEAKAETVKRLL